MAAPEPASEPGTAAHQGPAQGAIVIATSAACREAAKALARQLYAAPRLRPAIDEATARALVGEEPAPQSDRPEASADGLETSDAAGSTSRATDPLTETREVVTSVRAACQPSCESSSVARRLMASLGRDLGAELVVAVSCPTKALRPSAGHPLATARVLQVADERFVPLVLTADAPTAGSPAYQWSDATRVLAALVASPDGSSPSRAETPRRTAPRSAAPATNLNGAPDEDDEDDFAFLSSPWFWGGLGAVVAVGVTVLAISQTSLNEPDVIRVQGRVSP